MPILSTKLPSYKQAKDVSIGWDNFRKGLNTLLKETELGGDELAQADNLVLVGKGVPTQRWGTSLYHMAGLTGRVRGLKGYYASDGTNELLAITDNGLMTKKSNASYSTLTGASWASGNNSEMAQLGDKMYVVNPDRELVRYDGTSLTGFPTLAIPTSTFATQASGVSGTNSFSYRVSAVSRVGETTASAVVEADNCPQDLGDGAVKVTWTGVSAASGDLKAYNIYGRMIGDERWLGTVDKSSTAFFDTGDAIPMEFGYPPTSDSTGGLKAKYIIRYEDRLVYAGIDGDPSKVAISARWPNHEIFDISFGGNFIKIEPDAGDDITGLSIFENKIIVFKERSIWEVTLSRLTVGNFSVFVPAAKLITKSHGCIAPRSILPVENDIIFLSRKGVYALGYEPNILNVLRTNEISAKVRPFFKNLTIAQQKAATAFYYDFKYGISFPGKDQTMVYDRERLAWMGPWSKDANVYENYYDSSDNEVLLYGEDDDSNVQQYSATFGEDNGTAFDTQLRTRKEDYGDWTLFKTVKNVHTLFRNVQGTVNVDIRLQERGGDVTTVKSFSVTTAAQSAGWGADQWANTQWGDTEEAGGATDIREIYREALLNKAARNMQLIVKTSSANDKYELLAVRSSAKPMGRGFIPSSERV